MRRTLLSLGLAVSVVGLLAPPAWSAVESEYELVQLINRERAARGLPALTIYWDLVDDARAHAGRMAGAGSVSHNPDLGGVTGGWESLGENVGRGASPGEVFELFMASRRHREQILGHYGYLGAGTVETAGQVYVNVIFMQGPPGLVVPPFWDDDSSQHQPDIVVLWRAGVTKGCLYERFCPDQHVSRAQMAAFLTRALGLPPAAGDHFRDDERSIFEADINALAAAGIAEGCGGGRFCPERAVSREEMAAFLTRALGLPPPGEDHFRDDEWSLFEADINALADAGVTGGCGPDHYCPGAAVTRAQMASFLVRALGL